MPSDFERQVEYRGLNVGHFLKYHSVEVPASVPGPPGVAISERIVKKLGVDGILLGFLCVVVSFSVILWAFYGNSTGFYGA